MISLDALIKPTVVDVVAPPTINAPVTAVVVEFKVVEPFTVKPPNVTEELVATACPIEMVDAPVPELTETPVPATFDVTPALVNVIEEPKATAPPPLIPVPAVTVTEEFVSDELPIFDNVFDAPLIVLFVSV
jgi:hypothetical protein